MKRAKTVREYSYAVMDRILTEYTNLSKAKIAFSIAELITSHSFKTQDLSQEFKAHQFASALKKTGRKFCENYGIWLPGSEHYITCAIYLFPNAPIYRILPIIKNNAIDFYLNDVMGREVFCHLPEDKQKFYGEIKKRMSSMTKSGLPGKRIEPVEAANFETLLEMEYIAPAYWFAEFTQLYCYHIEVAHKDCNSIGLNHIQGIEDYMHLRSHISGMPHTVKLIDFSTGAFIHKNELTRFNILSEFEQLNKTVSLIGCLMNDLFSFEKEVIDNRSDSNLISILMLNDCHLDLAAAIHAACLIVKNLLIEYSNLLKNLTQFSLNEESGSMVALKEKLSSYLVGVKKCVQACWIWQAYSKRYKRNTSIWSETSLIEAIHA